MFENESINRDVRLLHSDRMRLQERMRLGDALIEDMKRTQKKMRFGMYVIWVAASLNILAIIFRLITKST